MKTEFTIIYFILGFCIILNIFIYFKLIKKAIIADEGESKLTGQLLLMDRRVSELKLQLQEISEKMKNIDNTQIMKTDEITINFRNDMSIEEIAKKMNKSIKEVELMLKMRGLI